MVGLQTTLPSGSDPIVLWKTRLVNWDATSNHWGKSQRLLLDGHCHGDVTSNREPTQRSLLKVLSFNAYKFLGALLNLPTLLMLCTLPTNHCSVLREVLLVLAQFLSLTCFGRLEGCEQFMFPHGLGYLDVGHKARQLLTEAFQLSHIEVGISFSEKEIQDGGIYMW